jgi:hypothetical protein
MLTTELNFLNTRSLRNNLFEIKSFEKPYSSRKFLMGSVSAILMEWKLTVARAIRIVSVPATINTSMSMRSIVCRETLSSSSLPLALDILFIPFHDPSGFYISGVDEDSHPLGDGVALFQVERFTALFIGPSWAENAVLAGQPAVFPAIRKLVHG